jgi:hypothetical protein
MPNVMPSQVVQSIDELFPHAATGRGDGQLQAAHSPQLIGIMNLMKAIPPELITVPPNVYADLVLAMSTIEYHLEVWTSRGLEGTLANAATVLAGATIEALLHWKLQQPPITQAARNAAV